MTDLQSKFPPPGMLPYLVQHGWLDGGQEFTLAPQGFHESVCAHVPTLMQPSAPSPSDPSPVSLSANQRQPRRGASRPVWGVFGNADRCIDRSVHRFSYDRMGATVTEVEGASHVVMISHPQEVAEVVVTAVRKVSERRLDRARRTGWIAR